MWKIVETETQSRVILCFMFVSFIRDGKGHKNNFRYWSEKTLKEVFLCDIRKSDIY